MKNRIRVGVLIFKDDQVLLVKHVHPETGFTWWVPPGGGIEGDESIFEAAEREVHEETGMNFDVGKLAYVRQFIYKEQDENNIALFLTAEGTEGEKTVENIHGKGEDEDYIKELQYFSKQELQDKTVYPDIIKGDMWDDYEEGFPETRFIGVETDEE